MSISGFSNANRSSTSLSAYESNPFRVERKSQNSNLSNTESFKRETAEFIFRGELLDDAAENIGFHPNNQNIAPANQAAINRYELTGAQNDLSFQQRSGVILNAYA